MAIRAIRRGLPRAGTILPVCALLLLKLFQAGISESASASGRKVWRSAVRCLLRRSGGELDSKKPQTGVEGLDTRLVAKACVTTERQESGALHAAVAVRVKGARVMVEQVPVARRQV